MGEVVVGEVELSFVRMIKASNWSREMLTLSSEEILRDLKSTTLKMRKLPRCAQPEEIFRVTLPAYM